MLDSAATDERAARVAGAFAGLFVVALLTLAICAGGVRTAARLDVSSVTTAVFAAGADGVVLASGVLAATAGAEVFG